MREIILHEDAFIQENKKQNLRMSHAQRAIKYIDVQIAWNNSMYDRGFMDEHEYKSAMLELKEYLAQYSKWH